MTRCGGRVWLSGPINRISASRKINKHNFIDMIPRRFRSYKSKIKTVKQQESILPEIADSEEIKRYAEAQKARMDGYKVGCLDNSGNVIAKVFSRGDDFLIYEIEGAAESESFRVLVDTKIDADPDGYIRRYESIKPDIGDFRAILYKGVHDKSVKHRAATAISTALRGDVDGARLMFRKINNQVNQEYREISNGRINYLGSAVAAFFVLLLFSVFLYLCRNTDAVEKNQLLKNFIYASSFAALGGFLSICIDLKDVEFERSLDAWKYRAYGVQRIILAATCGLISYLLVASDILLSFLTRSANAKLALMAICVLSGFSEKLIPNALRRLESKDD